MRSLTLSVVLILLGLIVFATGCNTYNSLVSNEEDVENAWSKVQTAYQRRADLIPNLVNTVKGAANFEQKTLQGVIEARSKATAITIDPTNARTVDGLSKCAVGFVTSVRSFDVDYRKLPNVASQQRVYRSASSIGRYGKPHQESARRLQRLCYQLQQKGTSFSSEHFCQHVWIQTKGTIPSCRKCTKRPNCQL
jgi:hypothetical protein